ncbi:MAG: glycosyltransferase family 9 protein, partial [Leptospirales bacterium]
MKYGKTTLLPRYIRGLPFLHIPSFPENWDGTILVLSAYGLGDTVNSLGLQRYFMDLYPKAQSILFAHHNWKDLLERSSFPFTYYLDFWGLEKNGDLPAPPFPNVIKSLKRFCRTNPNSCVGFADIEDPTRFARGERHTETVLRMVGVDDFNRIKPFVPLKECDWEDARTFLNKHKISPQRYCVIGPEASSSKKEWGEDRFFSLSEQIYKISKVPTLFLGQNESCSLNSSPHAISAKSLPLPVASALIAMSSCFIGNDSGLAHIASAFDAPVFTINLEPGIIPFEIRPLTRHASQIISFAGEIRVKPQIETVLWTTLTSIQQTSVIQNPSCFACGKPMRHILEASPLFIHRMCFCGARQLETLNSQEFCTNY